MPPARIITPGGFTVPIICQSAIFLFTNYQFYRVYTGTHPFFSPKLEAAGVLPRPAATVGDKRVEQRRAAGDENSEERWMNVNGVPIPSFDMLMRPFRRE